MSRAVSGPYQKNLVPFPKTHPHFTPNPLPHYYLNLSIGQPRWFGPLLVDFGPHKKKGVCGSARTPHESRAPMHPDTKGKAMIHTKKAKLTHSD